MLKKCLSGLAVAGMLLTLSACGDESNTLTPSESGPPIISTDTPTTEPVETDGSGDDGDATIDPEPTSEASATSSPDDSVDPNTPVDDGSASGALEEVQEFGLEYLQAADAVVVDLEAFGDELEAAIDGTDMDNDALDQTASPEEIFSALSDEQMKNVHDVSVKHNPLSVYFDYSNSSIQEATMVNLLVVSLASMGNVNVGGVENTPATYTVNADMIEVSGDTATLPTGTLESSAGSILGAIEMQLNKADDGWLIDSANWYANAMSYVEE